MTKLPSLKNLPVLRIVQERLRLKRYRLLLSGLIIAFGFFVWAEIDRQSGLVSLTYCVKYTGETAEKRCVESKALKVPADYFDGNPDKPSFQNTRDLLVAYPSMKPWHTVPYLERWSTQKIKITLYEVREPTARRSLELTLSAPPKPVRLEQLYGLDQYMKDSWGKDQILAQTNSEPQIFIHCAFTGLPADETRIGCTTDASTPWGLAITYRHKRVLLSQWSDIHAKTMHLLESFVVVS
jgi:hypothetical protein